mgnify:CR=1 FL=1|jgi:hypothetical protein
MSANYSLAQDLKEAAAMADSLESYVRGTELYGNAGGGYFARQPSLTIGALAMRLRRLEALSDDLDAKGREQLRAAQQRYRQVEKEWSVHFGEKALKEAHSRLDAMRAFFQECANDSKSCAGNYPPELLRRTIVEELLPILEQHRLADDDLADKLKATDGNLRGIVRPSAFNWSPLLQPVYPQDRYWWLYQRPPQD